MDNNTLDRMRGDIVKNLSGQNALESAKKSISGAIDAATSKAKEVFSHSPLATPKQPTTYKYDEKAVAPKPKTPVATPKPKMASYKSGTDYVPKTGPAKLHKGEAVLKKEDAEKMRSHLSGAAAALGHSEEKPKKEIKHIVTKKAKSGGYIHEHHHTHPEHHPMEEHVSPDQDSMVEHMMEHMGQANDGEAEADAGQSGIEAQAQPQMGA